MREWLRGQSERAELIVPVACGVQLIITCLWIFSVFHDHESGGLVPEWFLLVKAAFSALWAIYLGWWGFLRRQTVLNSLRSAFAKLGRAVSLFPADQSTSDSPPRLAAFVLALLLDRHNKNQIIGDLAEEFHEEILPRFGLRAARLWYWKKTLSVVLERNPLARRLLIGGGLVKAGEMIWRTFSG